MSMPALFCLVCTVNVIVKGKRLKKVKEKGHIFSLSSSLSACHLDKTIVNSSLVITNLAKSCSPNILKVIKAKSFFSGADWVELIV